MITTAILATIGGSLLFASQNYDIQPNHQNIQNVVSILEAPSKTETKINTNTKNPEEKQEGKIQPLFHPDFPDYEIFEQTEIGELNSSYTRNAPHKWDTKFKKVKILSNGIVPYTNEKFNINNPKNFNAIYGYIPGKYYIGLEALSNREINNIENIKIYLETISSLELISIKKSEYSGYNINFDISKISQKELYDIENKVKNNSHIKYIEKSSIILEEYNNSKMIEALQKQNIDTMYDL